MAKRRWIDLYLAYSCTYHSK